VAYVGPITPTTLSEWHSTRITADTPPNTSYLVQFYTRVSTTTFDLINDGELPGNSVGFSAATADIRELDAATFPTIYAGITLETTDTAVTPAIDELQVFYSETKTPLANVDFEIRGSKDIGTDASSTPVFKYTNALQTDGGGELSIVDLEFDEYTFDFTGYDIATACDDHPTIHEAGEETDVAFWLVGDDTNTLRVRVETVAGEPVPGAEIAITRPISPFTRNDVTNNCGQSFFTGGIPAEIDYEVEVSAPGFITETVSPQEISGDSFLRVILTQ
jgi:hypothetical protein